MSSSHVLVLNCGSSSLKFAIIDSSSAKEHLSGLAERLGESSPQIKYKFNGQKHIISLSNGDAHEVAINELVDLVKSLKLDQQLVAVGHRVVHGGEHFTKSALINDTVLDAIKQTATLAPLHNPANLLGIEAATEAFATLPQIAVFDTAFHQSMAPTAFLYALPYSLYEKHSIRRYGFHGTSHYYVSAQAVEQLGLVGKSSKIVTAHLGNGCSVCAVKDGKSVDTSMGLTPLEGLVMGTRSGDIDPGLFAYLVHQLGYSATQIDTLLNKESGLLGISELSNDCRTIEESAAEGHEKAQLALDIFCFRLAKQIASFAVPLGGIDALVFTGGIGENSDVIRASVINQLSFLGFQLNNERNLAARFGNEGIITDDSSNPIAMIIPTNEELVIAQDAAMLAGEQ
ncbi:acetate kinase [Pseudoalteromonas luteoviolacea]|uniref:Acetate kinase n=1 Tax=Pseudoalteromonas luteoviolacea S4054 TaxID=1129367 RepID=A0A0F6AB64_9GAMM|nr:acetate kinase [Pseudoalteromonas luteoviolacea]AOT08555.1 acetate kinase [Pseudoalteromonas luteoviolacea]AOT13471.1 acetate kinase [Pseudoalteromonas luteoviolacea]AOT18384.1 acetate kinase [Pseudoalteromonas luteoviolacea]KKE83447.1 acetate kinase [Pseudoalteromonas luteoviolacea S4054]KZN75884.1 acetate kinase [Pseudoalteromonas luteoviolacea S4047-1]